MGTVGSRDELALELANLRMQLNSFQDKSVLLQCSSVMSETLLVEGQAIEFEAESGAYATVISSSLYWKQLSRLYRL